MNIFKIIVTTLLLGSLAACGTTGTQEAATETKKEVAKKEVAKKEKAEPTKTIDGSDAAAGSKFSRVKLEMGIQEIIDTIGEPTERKTYETGKRWIPFYYGPDTRRTELLYKDEGRLTIGGNGRLIGIVVDTSEDGYR